MLCLRGDPWRGENIFIHEFVHGLYGTIAENEREWNVRLHALYDKAKKSGRLRGYAIEGGIGEFRARLEGFVRTRVGDHLAVLAKR